jgi:WXG100 protein secretion system (Wss), protein YukD
MSGVLVTVVGPAGARDLVVPAEAPVAWLLDALAGAVGAIDAGYPAGDWSLRLVGGDRLAAGESLADGGVHDGAVLVLADGDRPGVAAPRTRQSAVIGVLSATAGMGRTTLAALLAAALAAGTRDLTVAVDAHPGAGSLSQWLTSADDGALTAVDLLALIDHPALSREELLAFLVWCGPGFGVLPTGPRRDRAPPLAQDDWRRLLTGLVRHGLNLVVDCPPGLGGPGTRAVLAAADQIVLVVEPSPSPASRRTAHDLTDRGLPVVAVPWPTPPGGRRGWWRRQLRRPGRWDNAPRRWNRRRDPGLQAPEQEGYESAEQESDEPASWSQAPGSHPSSECLPAGQRSSEQPSSRHPPAPGPPSVPGPPSAPGHPLACGPPAASRHPAAPASGHPSAFGDPSAWGDPSCWDHVYRVAQVLVADWEALGLVGPGAVDGSTGGREG